MVNIFKNFLKSKVVRIALPFLIFITLSIVFILCNDVSTTVFSKKHNINDVILKSNNNFQPLYHGDKYVGKVRANDNYFGIIQIPIQTYNRQNDGYIVFRIREIQSNKWYYSSKINTLQFNGSPSYLFGFPVLSNSQNKEYIFELESINGSKTNAISIDHKIDFIVTKYKYPKIFILHNPRQFISFIGKKSLSEFQIIESIYSLLIILIFSITFINMDVISTDIKKSIYLENINKYCLFNSPFIIFLFLLTIIDIFFIKTNIDLVYLLHMLMWFNVGIFHSKTKIYLSQFIIWLLMIGSCLLFINDRFESEKTAAWIVLFLLILISIAFIEKVKNSILFT